MARRLDTQSYELESWIDPRLEVGASDIHGVGLLARATIQAGEVVVVWGGYLFTTPEIEQGLARLDSIAEIGEGLYLAGTHADPKSPNDYINHSCDPNCWLVDEVTIAARRDIAPGEDVTIDYALFSSRLDWNIECCECGSNVCRGILTTDDWKKQDLQSRYAGHFSPYLNLRIKRLELHDSDSV